MNNKHLFIPIIVVAVLYWAASSSVKVLPPKVTPPPPVEKKIFVLFPKTEFLSMGDFVAVHLTDEQWKKVVKHYPKRLSKTDVAFYED